MRNRATDEQREEMRILFTKGMLACEEIGERYGMTRQGVALILKKMGVSTAKKRFVVQCAQCANPVEKTRAEIRKHEQHFCSPACYNEFVRDPAYKAEVQRQRVLREKCQAALPVIDGIFAAFHETGKDILIFKSKEDLLEWKRTRLPKEAVSLRKHDVVEVTYTGDDHAKG